MRPLFWKLILVSAALAACAVLAACVRGSTTPAPLSATQALPTFPPAPPTPIQAPPVIRVTVPVTTNLRAGPSTAFPILGQARPKSVIVALAINPAGDWLQVRFENATDGKAWVLASLTNYDPNQHSLPLAQDAPGAPPDAQTGEVYPGLAADPDNTYVAVAGPHNAQLYSLVTQQFVRALDTGGWAVTDIAWSLDGNRLALGLTSPDDKTQRLQIWYPRTWELGAQADFVDYGRLLRMRWSPNDLRLAVACENGLFVWDAGEKRIVEHQAGFVTPLSGVAWSSDSQQIAAAPDQGSAIRLWQSGEVQYMRLFDQKAGLIRALDWSPDGATIASAHANQLLVLWNVENKKPLPFIPLASPPSDLAYAPDGDYLAVAGDGLTLWDPQGKKMAEMKRPDGSLPLRLAWIEAGRKLLARYANGRIGVWLVPSGNFSTDIPLNAR